MGYQKETMPVDFVPSDYPSVIMPETNNYSVVGIARCRLVQPEDITKNERFLATGWLRARSSYWDETEINIAYVVTKHLRKINI